MSNLGGGGPGGRGGGGQVQDGPAIPVPQITPSASPTPELTSLLNSDLKDFKFLYHVNSCLWSVEHRVLWLDGIRHSTQRSSLMFYVETGQGPSIDTPQQPTNHTLSMVTLL